jgi:polyhydroxybutyrate depolymerase
MLCDVSIAARARLGHPLRVLAALVVVLALPACSGEPADESAEGGTVERSLTVGDAERSYRVHVPAGQEGRSLPVVIALHGGGGSGSAMEAYSGLSERADEDGFVVVYPDGSGRLRDRLLTWNAHNCCGYAAEHDVDDVAFVDALITEVGREFGTDPRRVYVTGHSNGGMLAYRLGCELSERIAAIAPVAGALNTDTCRPARPVPVVIFHGTADRNVPYEGGSSEGVGFGGEDDRVDRPVSAAVAFWTGHNRCTAAPVTARDGTVVHTAYRGCAEESAVELYATTGGGHAWPGGEKVRDAGDAPAPEPDAAATMWDFFSAHRLP